MRGVCGVYVPLCGVCHELRGAWCVCERLMILDLKCGFTL